MAALRRYERWDGTQDPFPPDQDDLFDQLAEDMFAGADFDFAMRRLLGRGLRDRQGRRLPGLEDLVERLRQRRQQQLKRYNLDGIFDELQEKLNRIVRLERTGIQERLERAKEQDPAAYRVLQRIAKKKQETLDQLPTDVGGAVRKLTDYEFMNEQAHQEFQQLLEQLKRGMTEASFRNLSTAMQGMRPEHVQALKDMLQALNRMIQQKLRGQEPDFQGFMRRFGHFFGPQPPRTLEELLQQMARQMAEMDSLMQSLSPEMRRQLQDLMGATFNDSALQHELAQLAAALELLSPRPRLGSRYAFYGEESVPFHQAMRLMGRMQELEELERALRDLYRGRPLTDEQAQRLQAELGRPARQSTEQLGQLTQDLERRGFLQRGPRGFELTARGMRKIGHKALRDLYARLKRDRFGNHPVPMEGPGIERSDESKLYEFGDTFDLDVEATLMNALHREGPGTPVRIERQDFEVHRPELATRAATVLMLDMSRSMPLRGYFYAAKKVALALDSLIRAQFPRDQLYVIGFSDYAREIKPGALAELTYNEYVYGTNIQHGLMLARQLLNRHRGGNKQVIIVTDGEPTAHMEGSQAVFFYPPLPETFHKTLLEVQRCTREHIIINTFMLDSDYHLVSFVKQLTRLNGGRAFFTSADRLGEYILVDYVKGKHPR
jgi:uncharacterized protein with von Willebrand factor type A (vWA) domain